MPQFASRGRGRGRGRGAPSNRGARGRGSGSLRGKGEAFTQKKSTFRTSRLEEDDASEDESQQDKNRVDGGELDSSYEASGGDGGESGDEGSDMQTANSYATLLQIFKTEETPLEPARKRRKLEKSIDQVGRDASNTKDAQTLDEIRADEGPQHDRNRDMAVVASEDKDHDLEDDNDAAEEAPIYLEEDLGVDSMTADPFEKHFVSMMPLNVAAHLERPSARRFLAQPLRNIGSVRLTHWRGEAQTFLHDSRKSFEALHVKKRLATKAKSIWNSLSDDQDELGAFMFHYIDILSSAGDVLSPDKALDLTAIHALNHVFKTRDHVIKNNARLSQHEGSDLPDLRDQGFTRPKVLFLLPTREACVRLVDSIVSICEPEQQENKARFLESYAGETDRIRDDKPADFRELFDGNDDDDFRLGLKFTRKTIKYFSAFYSSDIIIASPLGLRKAIENAASKDSKKDHDSDFLSSIEIVVVDHAHALQMQNWQHVEYVFSQLNLLPKEAHGCDFSRVRTWYLDGHAKHLRQTIVLSNFLTPEMNALASTHMLNIAGKVKYNPIYKGAMLDLPATLPSGIAQTFLRFECATPAADPNSRFQYFTTSILSSLLRDRHLKGNLIFVPSYFDFVRLRNHFATSNETTSLSFGAISEFTPVKDVMRARSHFISGRHSVLLYTGRAHHFFRYKLKSVKRVVFYGLPDNPLFWPEIVGFLGLNSPDDEVGRGRGFVRAMFSKWDVLKLERIVGTERVKRLVSDKGGDTFDFV